MFHNLRELTSQITNRFSPKPCSKDSPHSDSSSDSDERNNTVSTVSPQQIIPIILTKESNRDVDNPTITRFPIKWIDTVEFVPPLHSCEVIKVYDGDTITVAVPHTDLFGIVQNANKGLQTNIYRFQIRLAGIDTPEIKGKTEDEKTAAKIVRDALSELILGKTITLINLKHESKWGRILADVYLDELYINQWLLTKRYAVAYFGATKTPPASWMEYIENGPL